MGNRKGYSLRGEFISLTPEELVDYKRDRETFLTLAKEQKAFEKMMKKEYGREVTKAILPKDTDAAKKWASWKEKSRTFYKKWGDDSINLGKYALKGDDGEISEIVDLFTLNSIAAFDTEYAARVMVARKSQNRKLHEKYKLDIKPWKGVDKATKARLTEEARKFFSTGKKELTQRQLDWFLEKSLRSYGKMRGLLKSETAKKNFQDRGFFGHASQWDSDTGLGYDSSADIEDWNKRNR